MPQDTSSKIYGLIGYPVKHSLSALMHNEAFKFYNIPAEYRLFEVEPARLEDFLLGDIVINDTQENAVRTKDISGFNITVPHKVRAKEILEKRFPFHNKNKGGLCLYAEYYVTYSGAVNTVKREGERLSYYNTDADGFRRSLKEDFPTLDMGGKNVLVLGCGGVGRAIIAALSWKNQAGKIYINDVSDAAINSAKKHFFSDVPQSQFLKEKIRFITKQQVGEYIKDCHLLINASSVGMKKEDPPVIAKNLLRKDLYVYDVVYNRETTLIRDARLAGCKGFADGRGMLLYQGAASFEFWRDGKEAPLDTMRSALEKGLADG